MFLRLLLLCAFLILTEAVFRRHGAKYVWHATNHGYHYPKHKTVIMNPVPKREKFSEEEMDLYLENQRNQLIQLAKKINADAKNICRWNYATLTDPQKRSCSCLAVFSFFNGAGDPFGNAYPIVMKIWEEFSQAQGAGAACSSRHPDSPKELHDICICMTGQYLV